MTATRIGKYELVRRLGGGGMAEVFLAKTIGVEGFARPVAIKRVLPHYSADPKFAAMFVNEARLSAGLRHANIVATLDFDRDDEGGLFLVMELIEGKDLDGIVETGLLPFSVVIYALGEVLRGLAAAHEAVDDRGKLLGIVHRDVSPHNVLVSWDGAVKVSDFGIAKAFQASNAQHSNMLKGKASYMSPEQMEAVVDLDGRADVFAVGVMLHQMLTGRPVFRGDSIQQVLIHASDVAKGREFLPWPHQIRPEVPMDLSQVAMTMLAPDRAQRYANARAAMAALKGCRDASLAGQDLLAQVMAERFADQAPRRSAGTPAAGIPSGGFAAEPPRPAMLSSPNQVTWMASGERAAFQAAETNTRVGATGAGYAKGGVTPEPTALVNDGRGAKRWWPLAIGGAAVVAAGISIAVMAGRGGSSRPPATSNATMSDAPIAPAVAPTPVPIDASVAPVPTPDAAPAAVMPPDAAPSLPPDAGTPRRPNGGHGGPKPGPGSGSNDDSGIHVINVGGG
ncbi:MAG: protein kinase [Deltaproteobacteria bacterium]|nr:protein kinase [Deltaproteobacteria bacterium]